MSCLHCDRDRGLSGRNLCSTCYYQLEIRNRYPLVLAHGYSGDVDFNGLPPPAESATGALPGTEEKIAVLAERAAQRRALWHPEDGKFSGE